MAERAQGRARSSFVHRYRSNQSSIAVAVVLHDAYFYWTHRLLHWRPLYRVAHHVHHRSTSPTPWAAYAFHPLEALIQAGIYVLIVFAVPYVFLGLAVIHTLVRRWSHPGWLLAAVYGALVLLGWPIQAVLLLGFVEDWAHLRRRLV